MSRSCCTDTSVSQRRVRGRLRARLQKAITNEKQVAALAGVSRPTVDLWLSRYQSEGLAGLIDRSHAAPREQVPGPIRARILAVTRMSPPADSGFSHWSSRAMAALIQRAEGVYVSHHYVAKLWRENGLKPHRAGTFRVSKDPAFAEKVADIVGLTSTRPAERWCCPWMIKTADPGVGSDPTGVADRLRRDRETQP
ncbi:MAG: helix-turn-helix domain-containing protein [Actinomycetota bacterium]|nr:helix-turn-helix domain-containing protein [Actinomycetota bacterium]MDQ3901805.1 helix-turn-helix domain-containing protein [Actinomycetota bacterium]